MNPNETTMYEEKYWVSGFTTQPELVDYLRNETNYTNGDFE